MNQQNPIFAGRRCVLALFAFALLALVPVNPVWAGDPEWRIETVSVTTARGTFDFKAEIADSDALRQRGLMYRTDMASDAAMLFLWDKPFPVSMWMHNTYLSLDMVFILANGNVVHVAENTVPQSREIITAGVAVSAVLELVAGTAARIGLKPGDIVTHAAFAK